MGRLLIAAMDETPRCFPVPATPSPELAASLIVRLQEYAKINQEVTWDSSAYAWFDKWYREGKELRSTYEDDRLAGYLERKPITVIKLAIIRTIVSGRTISTEADLQWGCSILDSLEVNMLKVYAAVGAFESRTIDLQLMERLTGFLRVKGYVALPDLMKHMLEVGLTATKTREMLASMKDAGIVDVRRTDQTVIYRFIPETKRAVYTNLEGRGKE